MTPISLYRDTGLRDDVACYVQARILFTLYDVNITKVLGLATHEDRKRVCSSNDGYGAGRNNGHRIGQCFQDAFDVCGEGN